MIEPAVRSESPLNLPQGRAPQPWRYFSKDALFLTPRVWIVGVEGASAAFGANVEKRIGDDDDPEADGAWGIGGSFDYYSAKLGNMSGSVLIVGAIANYHFLPSNGHLDPFLGAGLGYAKAELAGVGLSGLLWQTQAGLRYAFTDATAVGAHVGTGLGNAAVSLSLKF